MVRESRKNAAGPAGGRLPAPPFGGIRRGVSANPPRTHQHFFLVHWGWVLLGFFSVCSADLTFAGGTNRGHRASCPCPKAGGAAGRGKQRQCESLAPLRALCKPTAATLCLSFPSQSRSPSYRGVLGLQRGKPPPSCCSEQLLGSTALLHGSVCCTALLQGSVCCTVSSTCLGCSRNPDFQQLTCHSSLLHADFSKRMSQLWSQPKTVEKKQQWEPVINVMMVIVQARGWSKPVPSTALQLDPLWMVTGWDTAGIASCMGLLSPDRQSSPDLGHTEGHGPSLVPHSLVPPPGAAARPALPSLPVICPRRNLHFIL